MSLSLSQEIFKNIQGFNWDSSNINKNQLKRGVSWQEAEATFRNRPIIILEDSIHSNTKNRYTLYGKSDNNRKLTIIFTIRENNFRIISARDQSKSERRIYDQVKK